MMTDSSEHQGKCEISLSVNGDAETVRAYPMERLLDVLRHELGLTGTKEGCGEGECGSCAVLMNGELVNSCLSPGASSRWLKSHYHRRPRRGSATERAADSISGMRWRTVRYLHSGNDSGQLSSPEQET